MDEQSDELRELTKAIDGQQSIASSLAALSAQPSARSYTGVTFTIGRGAEDDLDGAFASELLADVREFDPEVHTEATGIGWGGDSGAVAVVLDAVERFGGVGGGFVLAWASVRAGCRRVVRLWRHLRRTRISTPEMSVGAVGYICLADLHEVAADEFDGLELVHARELMPEAGAALGHSGAGDLYVFLFAGPEASWLYLANSHGRLLHRSRSGPVPPSFYGTTGYSWDTTPAELPPFLAEGFDADAG